MSLARDGDAAAAVASGAGAAVREALGSGGAPLDGAVRAHMESAFGADFSDVRIHTGPEATRSARALHALAYTVGSQIVFAGDHFAPATDRGHRTLVHELTHVIQQAQGPVAGSGVPDGDLSVSHPADHFEREAERNAASVTMAASGQAAARHASTSAAPQRRAPATAELAAVQREFTGTWSPDASAPCLPTAGQDSTKIGPLVRSTEWRANVYLPQVDIRTDADLRWYLTTWKEWGECVTAALAGADKRDVPSSYSVQFDKAYRAAVKTLFLRAAQGTGTTAQLAVAANLDLLLPAVRRDIETYIKLDKAERLSPGASPEIVLKMLNPGDRLGNYCQQNCPAAAEAVQDYLQTGVLRPDDCTPIKEAQRAGYLVEENWGPQKNWPATWPDVVKNTSSHGTFVMIEGDRLAEVDGLTQWHYFIVLNIKGTRFAIDAYTHQVREDIPTYVQGLKTKLYRVSSGHINVEPKAAAP